MILFYEIAKDGISEILPDQPVSAACPVKTGVSGLCSQAQNMKAKAEIQGRLLIPWW